MVVKHRLYAFIDSTTPTTVLYRAKSSCPVATCFSNTATDPTFGVLSGSASSTLERIIGIIIKCPNNYKWEKTEGKGVIFVKD